MTKRTRRPSPAMIVGIIALVFALTGTAVGAKKLLGLGAFKDGVKNKTVGVGKLQYVQSTIEDPIAVGVTTAVATCPGNYEAIGGGIKIDTTSTDPTVVDDGKIHDSYPTTSGWTGRVESLGAAPTKFITTAICARSRAITGTPPTG